MITVYEGAAAAGDGRFAIVVARFNQSITERMLDGAVPTLTARGIPDDRIDVAWVPGAFEIPTVASRLASAGRLRRHPVPGRRDSRPNDARPAHQSGGEHGPGPVGHAVQDAGDFRHSHLRDAGAGHRPQRRPGGDDRQGRRPGPLGNKGVDCAEAALEMVNLLSKLPSVDGFRFTALGRGAGVKAD